MPESAFVSMVPEIKQRATDRSLDVSLRIIQSQLGVYDEPLDRGERILRFLDFSHSGVLDILGTVKPKLQAQLISTYRRDMAQEMRVQHGHGDLEQSWFDLEDMPPDEIETERKFAVNLALLPQLPQPWALVQGYHSPSESLRLIPARGTAFARLKRPGIVSERRAKTSRQQPYQTAVDRMLSLPLRVAVKDRHILRDETGRVWLIDHVHNGDGMWWAETELQTAPPITQLPPWIGRELTLDPSGYTYSHSQPMDVETKQRAIDSAKQRGSIEPYSPSEDPDFQWMQPVSSSLETGVS